MAAPTYTTTKKTYFYNFFPTKAEEEASEATAITNISQPPRMLVEIRDLRPPPILNPQNPWKIRKSLTKYEIETGVILVSFHDTFEYIIRYWNLSMGNHIAILGHRIAVEVWDLTEGTNPKKYEGNDVYFQITQDGNYVLSCSNMIKDRALRVGDYIGLYWSTRESNFRIKLFYRYI